MSELDPMRIRHRLALTDGLIEACLKQQANMHHEFEPRMLLKVTRKSTPKNWDRVRVLPKVYGRVISELSRGTFLVDVPLVPMLTALRLVHAELTEAVGWAIHPLAKVSP